MQSKGNHRKSVLMKDMLCCAADVKITTFIVVNEISSKWE